MNSELEWAGGRIPIVIVGPTAVGKTDIAIELAMRINGEVVNADSMQVYVGMDIGTAKPDLYSRSRVNFYLLDVVRPDQPYNVSDWKQQAEVSIHSIAATGRHPIVCGGTGLYVRALIDDWALAQTPEAPAIRSALRFEAEKFGSAALHQRLERVDPKAALRLHPNDSVRIVRALEVYEVTGTPLSEHLARDQQARRSRRVHRFGLTRCRTDLYTRIDMRVDTMLAQGFEAEVRGLLQKYSPKLPSMRSLGYKEICNYLHGEMQLEEAIKVIKQNTRRFCKRQLTWFRADQEIQWLDVTTLSPVEVAASIQNLVKHDAERADDSD